MDVTQEDKEALAESFGEKGFIMPNVKLSVYKNRRGKFTKGYLWMYADKSTSRFNGLFYTLYDYTPEFIEDVNIDLVI